MIHTTVGLYPNGEFKVNGVPSEKLAGHLQYNLQLRPGRALILDGILIYKGNVNPEVIKNCMNEIRDQKNFKMIKDSQPYH